MQYRKITPLVRISEDTLSIEYGDLALELTSIPGTERHVVEAYKLKKNANNEIMYAYPLVLSMPVYTPKKGSKPKDLQLNLKKPDIRKGLIAMIESYQGTPRIHPDTIAQLDGLEKCIERNLCPQTAPGTQTYTPPRPQRKDPHEFDWIRTERKKD